MCYFITATLPKDADHAALDKLARGHARQFLAQENASIEKQLGPGMRYFVTTWGHCDCGTGLGCLRRQQWREAKDWPEIERKLLKKGWSRTKVERALAQMREQDAAPKDAAGKARDAADLERWREFVAAVLASGHTCELGLLLHMYSGGLDRSFELRASKIVRAADAADALANMEEDVLLVFRAKT